MELRIVLAVGVLLAVFVFVTRSFVRERREEDYEDEREYFRKRYPRAWGLVEGAAARREDESGEEPPGECPVCGTENGPEFTYCRGCSRPLPGRDG